MKPNNIDFRGRVRKYKPALWKSLPSAKVADAMEKEIKSLGLTPVRFGNRVEVAYGVSSGKTVRKFIRSATPKTASRRRQYNKLLKPWLALPENKFCRVYQLSVEFRLECVRQNPLLATQCHHRRGRRLTKLGDLLLLQSEWVPVSASGHQWIDSHRDEARALGLLCPVGQYDTWPDGVPSNL